MDPTRLSHELRNGRSDDLTRRRWIIGLSLFNAAIGGVVGAYQTGIIKHLPDPPGPFDSDRVDASDYGYKRLNTPDGLLMTITFAVTAALAASGGRDRAEDNPAVPIALAAKSLYDVATAFKLAAEEWEGNKALCAYCQVATVASVIAAGLALPEASRAGRALLEQSRS